MARLARETAPLPNGGHAPRVWGLVAFFRALGQVGFFGRLGNSAAVGERSGFRLQTGQVTITAQSK